METQNHKKTNQSGHSGGGVHIHLCHKCGWPFPNPHPSAKQRRSHKKICGTIEGYKLTTGEVTPDHHNDHEEDDNNTTNSNNHLHNSQLDSAVSVESALYLDSTLSVGEGQHLSEDELRTPSSKPVEKTMSNRSIGGGGFGSRSNRSTISEDEVFSDAITHFVDTPSPSIADRVVGEPVNLMEEVSDGEPRRQDHQSHVDDSALPGNTCRANYLVPDKQHQASQLSENEKEPVDMQMVLKEPASPALHSFTDMQQEAVVGEAVNQSTLASAGPNADAEENEVVLTDSSAQDQLSAEITSGKLLDTIVSAEELTKGLVCSESSSPAMEIIQEQSNGIKAKFESPQAITDEKVEACVRSEHDIDNAEGKICTPAADEKLRSLVVLDGVSMEENSANIYEGDKDHKISISGISTPVVVPSDDCVVQKEDHVIEESSSTILPTMICQNVSVSTTSNKGNHAASAVFHPVDDKLEHESAEKKLTVAEVPINNFGDLVSEKEAPAVCESSVTEFGSGLKGSDRLEEQSYVVPDISVEDMSRKDLSLEAKMNCSDKQEVKSDKNVVVEFGDKRKDHDGPETHDIKYTENNVPVAMTAFSEPSDVTPSQMSRAIHFPGDGDASDDAGLRTVDSAVDAVKSGEDEENSAESKRSSVYEFHTLELHGGIDLSNELKATEQNHVDTESDTNKTVDKTGESSSGKESQALNYLSVAEDVDDHGISDNKMAEVDCNDMMSATARECKANLTRKDTIYMDAVSSFKNAVDVDNPEELDKNTSGLNSSSMQVGSGGNLIDQNLASTNDCLADTASQTDNLEGHWGSVSVLSALSDAPAGTDTEPPASNSSPISEAPSLKPEATANDQQIDKSKVSEATTSTMSVEQVDRDEHKESSCEIQTLENPSQLNSSTLQSSALQPITQVGNDTARKGWSEEITAKGNNWSTGSGRQHTPLKNLLGEAYDNSRANSPDQKKDDLSMNNGASGKESVGLEAAKAKAEAEKEWSSPARYPANIERKKGKVKSRPYWVPLFCCSSSIHSN